MAENEIKEEKVTEEQKPAPKVTQKPVDIEKKYKGAMVAVVVLAAILLIGGVAVMGVATKRLVSNQRGAGMMTQGRSFGEDSTGLRGQGMRMRRGINQDSAKVTAVDGKQFTIDLSGTTYKVQINDSTRFPVDSVTTVKVGDQVVVIGEKDSNGMIQADRIIVNPTTTVN